MKTMSLTNASLKVSVEFTRVRPGTYRMRNTLGEAKEMPTAEARQRVQTLLGPTGRAQGWEMDR